MNDRNNAKHLVKDVVYALCKSEGISADVYKSVLLSITMLGDDRVPSEKKAKINLGLTLFVTELLSANDDAKEKVSKEGISL